MADIEIHELITAEELSSSDVIAEQRENSGTWLTRKLTFNALGLFLNKVLNYASDLHTTSKTIIGAINELAQSSGQSLDTLNDVDIDSQTLADGQGIVYDATAQKWKNGAVAGGHTYSTTEQVVGTWIDGSPLYEKVFSFTANLNAGVWVGTGQYMPDGANHIINVTGIANDTTDTSTIPMIGYIKDFFDPQVANKELVVMNVRGQDLGNKPALAIVQYTKTST